MGCAKSIAPDERMEARTRGGPSSRWGRGAREGWEGPHAARVSVKLEGGVALESDWTRRGWRR
jgi:hypothetical protein